MTSTRKIVYSNDSVHTTITRSPATVSRWLSRTQSIHRRRLHHLIVGLDVEWQPSFTRGVHHPVAVLQICVGHRCLIYQILQSEYIHDSLVFFLSNPYFTFVGVGVKDDLMKLDRDYGFGGDTKFLDLRELAVNAYGAAELRQAGLKSLASLVLGKELEKPKDVTLSRWDRRWLTMDQVRYACLDAFVSFEIGRILVDSKN
ncbi:Werner Syndrome-like exonuclease [Dorcoceras hygrometricum]|uniref:Werner Syndrome-like exonuclease n=1 Tax=Dorcoceras hygrometricum TaxID=472368 RepID=A0A2Z7A7M5_9LAMI|nr:Werner Syndrome-like exonuclease [Dorcoceras hygrometricum]